MKICMISYHTCPLASEEGKETGGMNIYVLELSKVLADRGHQVDIYTRSSDVSNPLIVEVAPNLRVIHLTAGPQLSLAKTEIKQYIPEFVASYVAFTTTHTLSYEVMHAHYYLSGLVGMEIKKRTPLPMIMTFHTLALMKNLVARSEAEMDSQERIDAEMLLVKESSHIISPSESDQQYLNYLYSADPDKVTVIPPGVDVSLFKPMNKVLAKKHISAEVAHRVILFAGRIEPLKGLDVLLYSMKILDERSPELNVCLWIVGGDTSTKKSEMSSELRRLEKIKHMLGISNSVMFVGQKPQAELPFYYNAAELVVMPSHYESFGMAAAEAMACGTPVITTNVTGISNLLDSKHEPLITSANNPLHLAEQMGYLLTDQQAYQEMSEAVLSRVQDLNWCDVSDQIIEIYQRELA